MQSAKLWNPDVVGMGDLFVVLLLIITVQVRVCDWLIGSRWIGIFDIDDFLY